MSDKNDSNSCCTSPAKEFRVRNGDDFVANDTMTEVELPSRVSDSAITKITGLLCADNDTDLLTKQRSSDFASYCLPSVDPLWQTEDGTYVRRLSRAAYAYNGYKIPPETLTLIGNIARENSVPGRLLIAFTRDLNRGPASFGHATSCWWGCYGYSRCAFKTNGGFAMRSFSRSAASLTRPRGRLTVTGRIWVLPIKGDPYRARPTFNTQDPDRGFLLFNGYGKLDLAFAARTLAKMTGMETARVAFRSNSMYINSGSAVHVYPPGSAPEIDASGIVLERHSSLFEDEQRALTAPGTH